MAGRHHFVPQGFLRGFAADPERSFVWTYDKRDGRRPKRKAIKAIAWQQDYYAQERQDGSLDRDTLERAIATEIDNAAPLIIRSIDTRPGDRVRLTTDERVQLALFVAFSLTRVPSFRDGIDEVHTRLAEITLSMAAQRDPRPQKAIEDGIRAIAKPSGSLRPMVQSAKDLAHSLIGKCWQFYVAPPDVPLPTSDNPVIFDSAYAAVSIGLQPTASLPVGPAHPMAEVVMNLRSDLALVCTPRDMKLDLLTFPLSPFDARKFTRGLVRAARHRVFYCRRCESFEALVKKYRGQEQRVRGT